MATKVTCLLFAILLLSINIHFSVVTSRKDPSFSGKVEEKIPGGHKTAHAAGSEEKVLLIGPNILLRPRPMPPCKRRCY
ncbi:hypothetical protein BDA96_06G262300 [Sorghum bicolor]|uniref:Uncharacterized protein n=2 Tax=Sorghum bicolor TaxID=4558 RepID=A0A921UE97_SORBI|nr:hypothetical protein BDA96_06G262300 [Sorghum bicolor]KXG27250.1 hypothetical protein SORBI_3006G239600 [Sorghum bicolor]